jgi:hypothetical protein
MWIFGIGEKREAGKWGLSKVGREYLRKLDAEEEKK